MHTWVVVADNSRARIFAAERAAGELLEIRDLAHPEARLHEGDLVTDKEGRARGQGGAHGLGHELTRKQDGSERFAADVCAELETARASGQFDKLYLVAAPAFLGLLRRHLSSGLRQRVAGELDKNLSLQDPQTIRRHLPEFL